MTHEIIARAHQHFVAFLRVRCETHDDGLGRSRVWAFHEMNTLANSSGTMVRGLVLLDLSRFQEQRITVAPFSWFCRCRKDGNRKCYNFQYFYTIARNTIVFENPKML